MTVQRSIPRSQLSTPSRELCEMASMRALTARISIDAAPRQMRCGSTGHQRFGRRAPGVDTGTAEELPLDNSHTHAGSGQPAGKGWAGLAGSDDDGIKVRGHKLVLFIAVRHVRWLRSCCDSFHGFGADGFVQHKAFQRIDRLLPWRARNDSAGVVVTGLPPGGDAARTEVDVLVSVLPLQPRCEQP